MTEAEYVLVSDLQRVRQLQLLLASVSPASRSRLDAVAPVESVIREWEEKLYSVVRATLYADSGPSDIIRND